MDLTLCLLICAGFNQFSGSLPTEIGLMTNLEHLYLGKYAASWLGAAAAVDQINSPYLCTKLLLLIIAFNDNLWGNVNPLFCSNTNHSATIHSNFSNLSCLRMPENVTCDCCSVCKIPVLESQLGPG
jgi:hypothetical protein